MSKKNQKPLELVEGFERNEQRRWPGEVEAEEESGAVEESEINALLQQAREERETRESREVARDIQAGLGVVPSPARIAEEMKRRSGYLRSRPMQEQTATWELHMLAELDSIEAGARALVRDEASGRISPFAFVAESAKLSLAAFAVRGRFQDLLSAQREPWPSRARPESGEERRVELAAIVAFLERKRRREALKKAS